MLVVCPASVVDAWVDAWTTWAPSVSVVAWRVPSGAAAGCWGPPVYVTSYDLARVDEELLKRLQACAAVVIDGATTSDPVYGAGAGGAASGRKASVVVALSGTPITHHRGPGPTLYVAPTAWALA